jgi:hypothetical protein
VLVAYDKNERGYGVPEDAICLARWASSNRQHAAGDLCGEPATELIGDTDLCWHHYERALKWFYKRIEEMPERAEEARKAAAEKARLIAEERSIVYYLHSETTGLIKIGFSTNYRNRLSALQGEHGPLRLLLATAGARKEEDEAHDAFAEHWDHGEWFRPGKSLLLHIQSVRTAQEIGRVTRLPQAVPVEEVRALIRAQRKAMAA